MISTHKPRKDPVFASSYRPISILGTIGTFFENILLARMSHDTSDPGLMRDEQLGLDPDIARPCSWPASLKE